MNDHRSVCQYVRMGVSAADEEIRSQLFTYKPLLLWQYICEETSQSYMKQKFVKHSRCE